MLNGLPMGWRWAPLIAQLLARGILRAALTRFGKCVGRQIVYIDNIAVFVRMEEEAEQLANVTCDVAASMGAKIKEGSLTNGHIGEWRGLV